MAVVSKHFEEDLDFLNNGSIMDLALRMNEIVEEMATISEDADSTKPNLSSEWDSSLDASTPDRRATETIIEDVLERYRDQDDDDDDDDDDGDAGLEDLQKEMQQFEAMQEQAPVTFTVTVNKPNPTSPVGISMKTVNGTTEIVAISPDGLLANSRLRPGFELLQVDGVRVINAKHAKRIIRNNPGMVSLVARMRVTLQ